MAVGLLLSCVGPATLPSPGSAQTDALNLTLTDSESGYLLGPGDRVQVRVLNEPDLSGEQEVLVDGSLQLPLIGTVTVAGLTPSQAATAVDQRFSSFLKYPDTTITLLRGRSLRIVVVGEVNRPGAYTVSPNQGTTGERGFTDVNATTLRESVPRVTQLLQLAGGITQQADVRNIEVVRPQPFGKNATFRVDLWALLNSGQPDQDLVLRDGDSIHVPQAETLILAEATELGNANFAPESIQVSVVGEVERPGRLGLPPNTSLNNAVLAAGGFTAQADQAQVQLIRLNPNGSVLNQTVAIDFTQALDTNANPPLQEADIVLVGSSGIAKAGDDLAVGLRPLNLLLDPIGNIGRLLRVFGVDF
ncbi:MAG: polysaccharide transporter [Synechococcaceae cyanobacterium SM2_3_1]|nr:polysaccharide transporter [Synechococcaceae cyanobacterium SM2_3_1]